MAKSTIKFNISALVLTKNEEAVLNDCLKQLAFASEIIVLDQKSTDSTIKIAKKFTDKVLESDDSNFANCRNKLAKAASQKWLLYVDADERFTQESIKEIKNSIASETYSYYYFPRKNIVLGKWLKHGGWWPDYVPKLIKKDSLIGWEGAVHESPKVEGISRYLEYPITHLTARNMDLMFKKSIVWAKIEAELFNKAEFPRVTQLSVIKATVREFISRYIFKRGMLDGKVGLIESVYQSLHQAIVQVYLWEIQNKQS